MTTHRVPGRGRVDHARSIRFSFDGTSYEGCAGDTVASALLANGIHLMGRRAGSIFGALSRGFPGPVEGRHAVARMWMAVLACGTGICRLCLCCCPEIVG